MNVRIKKSALQNVLLNLLNEADAPATPPPEQAAAPAPAEDFEKRAGKEFSEKVRELQQMKTGDIFAVGDRKFKKKAGSFYLSGAQEGLETEKLLSFVKPEFRKEIGKKLAKDAKEGTGAAGVTIMGNQFIDSTERSATFKLGGTEGGSTVWEDMSGIPVQVIAQYYFQTEKGVEFGSDQAGALAADVLGGTGANQLVYRSDELMIVIDPATSNMHIMSADFNGNDPLMAMKTLLTQIKLNDKVGDDPNDKSQGSNEYPGIRAGYNAYLKPDGTGEKYSVPLRNFDLGALRKAIGSVRTIFSKFVDLFNTDDIEMNFVFSPWGPSMTRSKVFGSDAFEGGTGAMTSRAINRLRDTGLFNEEALPRAGIGTYGVRTDDRQDLVTLMPDTTATPVTVTPVDGRTGVSVAGLSTSFGVKFTDDVKDTYDDTLGDAYLLYMNGAMSVSLPKDSAPTSPPAETSAPVTAGGQTVADFIKKNTGKEVCTGAVYFDFNSATPKSGDTYVTTLNTAIGAASAGLSDAKENKLAITLVGTADPSGGAAYNSTLAAKRINAIDNMVKDADSLNQSFGEDPWPAGWAKYANPNPASAALRFVKAYWGFPNPDALKASIVDFAKESSKGAITEAKNQITETQLRAYIRRMLLNE